MYDLSDVELRIAKWHEEQERCKIHGGPYTECGDDEKPWYPQRMFCWPEAQFRAAMRMFEELHTEETGALFHDGSFKRWAKEFSPAFPFRYDDGMRFFMSPVELAPWDEWTTKREASPFKPPGWDESVAQQAPQQQRHARGGGGDGDKAD